MLLVGSTCPEWCRILMCFVGLSYFIWILGLNKWWTMMKRHRGAWDIGWFTLWQSKIAMEHQFCHSVNRSISRLWTSINKRIVTIVHVHLWFPEESYINCYIVGIWNSKVSRKDVKATWTPGFLARLRSHAFSIPFSVGKLARWGGYVDPTWLHEPEKSGTKWSVLNSTSENGGIVHPLVQRLGLTGNKKKPGSTIINMYISYGIGCTI